jgi:hypothetical protein
MHPVTPQVLYLKIVLLLLAYGFSSLPAHLSLSGIPPKILCAYCISFLHSTCSANPMVFGCITLINVSEKKNYEARCYTRLLNFKKFTTHANRANYKYDLGTMWCLHIQIVWCGFGYTQTHTCTYTNIHIHTHTHAHTPTGTHIQTRTHIYIHTRRIE